MYTTVDSSEIEHFDKYADEWWSKEGKYRILHEINPLRLGFIRDSILDHFGINDNNPRPFSGLKIIDIGCGGGLLSLPLARLGGDVFGLDASKPNIEAAELYARNFNLQNLSYECAALESMDAERKFDVILAFEILEHVSSIENFIHICSNLLKKGGLILFSTINRNLKSYVTSIFLAENILGLVQKGTHSYNKLVKPSEINEILEIYNLQIKGMKGLSYSVFKRKWFLSDDISVNYMMKICGT